MVLRGISAYQGLFKSDWLVAFHLRAWQKVLFRYAREGSVTLLVIHLIVVVFCMTKHLFEWFLNWSVMLYLNIFLEPLDCFTKRVFFIACLSIGVYIKMPFYLSFLVRKGRDLSKVCLIIFSDFYNSWLLTFVQPLLTHVIIGFSTLIKLAQRPRFVAQITLLNHFDFSLLLIDFDRHFRSFAFNQFYNLDVTTISCD